MNQVLFVHGFLRKGKVFRAFCEYFEKRGWRAEAMSYHPALGQKPIDELALQVASYADEHFEGKFDLVSFSMGGLVCRHYLHELGGSERVRKFATISSPLKGTWAAWGLGLPAVRQMRPGSDFLKKMHQKNHLLEVHDYLALWTPFDLMILPPTSSLMGVGREVMVPALAHPLMVYDKRCHQVVFDHFSGGHDS